MERHIIVLSHSRIFALRYERRTISQVKAKSRILPENGLETDFVLYLIDLSGIMGGYIVSVIL